MTRLRDRSTADLLVIGVAGTVCFVVIGTTLVILLSELFGNGTDTDAAAQQIGDIINTLIGLLAGFLAGKYQMSKSGEPEEGSDDS